MALIETYILVPTTYNNGEPVEAEKFEALQALYIEKVGGLTIEPETKQGFWTDGTTIYKDINLKYIAAIEHWNQVKDILEIAEYVKKEWNQEAVYINIAGIADII